MIYFCDTYAILEILKGNPNYKKFLFVKKLTTKLNLLELHYALLKDKNKNLADYVYYFYLKNTVPLTDDIILNASLFRYKHIAKKFSYIDCIGYVTARKYGIMFLTGDEAFKTFENVEFVK